MRSIHIRLTVGFAALATAGTAFGFSLLGPQATWMTARIGYAINPPLSIVGGPVQPGEEYRWQVPLVYYGFSPDFYQYFGPEGATAIDQAFQMVNALPPASRMVPDAYPLGGMRVNERAAAIGLTDLKSFTLGQVLEKMGLADPTRFVFTLRSRWTTSNPDTTNYFTIQRNYDPITWRPTSYINGVLWTYQILENARDQQSLALGFTVDPTALNGLLSVPAASPLFMLTSGGFLTSLTRDDIGGLRYIYRPDNYNIEGIAPVATALQGGGGPWGSPPGTTNAVGTNTVTTNTVVTTSTRGGRDKVTFQRVNYDGLLGTFSPFTNSYIDTYLTNGLRVNQYLERAVAAPDILFHAADLQGDDGGDTIIIQDDVALEWSNNDATNAPAGNLGPGVINPGDGVGPAFTVTYNSVGEIWYNWYLSFFDNLDELTATSDFILWGSFDGSTAEPLIYPIGTSIQQVEAQILSGEGDPWTSP